MWSAVIAIVLWGACGWGTVVPQQHRLVSIAPAIAPVVLGLFNSATYIGTTMAGVIGAAGIQWAGADKLGFIATALVAATLAVSGLADRAIATAKRGQIQSAPVPERA